MTSEGRKQTEQKLGMLCLSTARSKEKTLSALMLLNCIPHPDFLSRDIVALDHLINTSYKQTPTSAAPASVKSNLPSVDLEKEKLAFQHTRGLLGTCKYWWYATGEPAASG